MLKIHIVLHYNGTVYQAYSNTVLFTQNEL